MVFGIPEHQSEPGSTLRKFGNLNYVKLKYIFFLRINFNTLFKHTVLLVFTSLFSVKYLKFLQFNVKHKYETPGIVSNVIDVL